LARSAVSGGLFRSPQSWPRAGPRIALEQVHKPQFDLFQSPCLRLLSTSRSLFCTPTVHESVVSPTYNSPITPPETPSAPPETPSPGVVTATPEAPIIVETTPEATVVIEGTPKIEELDFVLPERPVSLDQLPEALLGEPAFDTIGLASWWPAGRLQSFMEWWHIGVGLEWWQTIIATTICVRLLVFPVVVYAQRNMAHMTNNAPEMARLQEKFTEARKRSDLYEMDKVQRKIQALMGGEGGVNPLKSFIPPFLQLPIFMSMFLGLRGMANCPVDSMKGGGLSWFSDLTVADPYYILPLLTSATLFIQFKLGVEYGTKLSQSTGAGKALMYIFPPLLLIFTHSFPAALTFYWLTTNVISVAQASFLRVDAIRKLPFIRIPEMKVQEIQQAQKKGGKKKGFVEGIREQIDNSSIIANMQQRQKYGRDYDERQFKEAATRKIKTFKYDPTKPVEIKYKEGKGMN